MKNLNRRYAVGYARYSTSNQNAISIQRQLDKINEVCAAEHYDLVDFYADEAESGTNTDRRDFQRLLADARAGAFDAVVIYDMFRGSRDIADWFNFRKEMRRLGVQVISASERLGDIDNPGDFLHEGVNALFGQMHVIKYRKDSIDGSVKRAKSGMFCGGIPPLGYDVARTETKVGNKKVVESHYIINPREAEVVSMIFQMYAQGSSYADILAEVHKTGITGKLGRPIEKNTLHYILKNKRYTGLFLWGEYEMRHMRKWVGRKREEGDDQIISIPDAIPRIVPQDIAAAVEARMSKNKKNRLNHSSKKNEGRFYLLSGLIRCGECGGPLCGVTNTSKGIEYKKYVCINKRKQRACAARDIRADKLENYILNLLRTRVLTEEFLSAMAEKILSDGLDTSARDAITDDIQSIQRKNVNLYAAIESGLNAQQTIVRINENENKLKILRARLSSLPATSALHPDMIKKVLLSDIERAMDNPQQQQSLISRYISSVVIYDDCIDLIISPNLTSYTAQKQNVVTNLEKLVTTAGSPGVNYAVFTNDGELKRIKEANSSVFAYRIPRSLVA